MTIRIEELAAVPATAQRRDPLEILDEQDATRIPGLVPVRHERMAATAFTFFRGAAAVMAADLAATPSSGIDTQLCGDAHLSNFGLFRSPERRMVFDLNDFDETHPGPFEWDVKRLAASIVIASQANGFDEREVSRCARRSVRAYRKEMLAAAGRSPLDNWDRHVDAESLAGELGDRLDTATGDRMAKLLNKAKHRDSNQALEKLCYFDLAGAHIRSDPPLLMRAEEIMTRMSREQLAMAFTDRIAAYARSLPEQVASVLAQYRFIEAARKVVGVGSVGTRCWIVLMGSEVGASPLFLQIKEAGPSVLSPYVTARAGDHQGRRVVAGQQLMQASSDIFLGWVTAPNFDGTPNQFYVRQLRDGKGAVVVEGLRPDGMEYYGELCGRVLAQAHARTAAYAPIAALLSGFGKAFDRAVADFAVAYSQINEADHQRLVDAIADGRMSSAPLSV